MTTEQNRDGIPVEQTARYTELMRKHGAGPLPLLEKMETLTAELATLRGALAEAQAGAAMEQSERRLKDAIATYRAAWIAYCDTNGPGAYERSSNINVAAVRMFELAGCEPFEPKVPDPEDEKCHADLARLQKATRELLKTPTSSIAREHALAALEGK